MNNEEFDLDVLFPVLPFAQASQPSLACELLAQTLRQNKIDTEVKYYNLEFFRRISPDIYTKFAGYFPRSDLLLGELLFSPALNGSSNGWVFEALAESMLAHQQPKELTFLRTVASLGEQATQFIDDVSADIIRRKPRIIALSSLFQQHVAVLSLAKRLKAQLPQCYVVIGGSNCEGAMGRETIRSFEFIDCVVSGPGETVLPLIVRAVLDDRKVPVLPGVFDRDNHPSEHAVNTWAPEPDLDDLPIPDYSGFFEQIGLVSDLDIGEVLLPFETSRGCWWGAKSHCTFCGLNGSSMRYRQKTPSRAIAELRQIKAQSPHGRLTAVDNILSLEYFESVLPALAREGVGPLFYEVKANLRRPHIVRLREAGISEIQPGIESFSDTSLRRMAKGTSSIQNASLLKMCKEEGVRTVWNLLYGFPGETVEDYQQQLAVIPHLAHLEPPVGYGPVRIDRFSPMHSHPEKFGISRLEPVPIYEHLYPGLSSAARYNLAYYFEGDFPEKTSFGTERSELERQIESWKAHHVYAFLTMLDVDRTKVLIDTRSPASPSVYRLHEGEVRFFEQSRDLNSWEEMQRCAHSNVGAAGQQLLDRYLSRGILLRSGSRAASLVTYCDKVGEVCAALIALRARDAHSLTGTQSIRVPTDILHKLETA